MKKRQAKKQANIIRSIRFPVSVYDRLQAHAQALGIDMTSALLVVLDGALPKVEKKP